MPLKQFSLAWKSLICRFRDFSHENWPLHCSQVKCFALICTLSLCWRICTLIDVLYSHCSHLKLFVWSWTTLIWIFILSLKDAVYSQNWHLKFASCLWAPFTCLLRLPWRENDNSQRKHLYSMCFLSMIPACADLTCFNKLLLWNVPYPHTSHSTVFPRVGMWLWLCFLNASSVYEKYWHWWHVYLPNSWHITKFPVI